MAAEIAAAPTRARTLGGRSARHWPPRHFSSRPQDGVQGADGRPEQVTKPVAAALASETGELTLPVIFDLLNEAVRKRHVVEVVGLLLAVLKRPFEEVNRGLVRAASFGCLYMMMNTVAATG
jgi:hypothetical protein